MKKMNLSFLNFLKLTVMVLELGLLAPTSWRAIGAEVRCIERERQALLQFKAGLVDQYGLLSSWGNEEDKRDCCEWNGVSCSNRTGHAQGLDLYNLRLQGKISSSLMELHNLMSLNLSVNTFEDSHIPDFFGSLSNLRYLSIYDCGFKGNIPSQLGSLSHLRLLDLGLNSLEGSIPYQLGNLSQLQLLDLCVNNFVGAIPHQLGNLSNLQELYLGDVVSLKTDKENGVGGEWLSSLTSLTHLTLSNITSLKYSHKWLQTIGKLPGLKELDLSSNNLSNHYILSLIPLKFNSSYCLSTFSLSSNSFTSSVIFQWLSNFSPNLVRLDLSYNLIEELVPYDFGSVMNSLENLYLYGNKLKGGLKSIGSICTLRTLDLSINQLSEELPTILQNLSGCARYSLRRLNLESNQITGTLSNLSTFTSLKILDLSGNRLNGTISKDLQLPSQLMHLSISFNSLKGVFTESHFANMPNLMSLDLANNSLALRFDHNWIPPFQLEGIYLASCRLGPGFPKWLQTQNNLTALDISDARISDIIPEWVWRLTPNLWNLNLSYNNLWGTIPNLLVRFTNLPTISLASNHLEGPIPQFLRNVSDLNLSNNKFLEFHTFLCAKSVIKTLGILDLSNNQLLGQLPDCWSHFKSLTYLDLSGNIFFGAILASIGSLQNLKVLRLRNNSFTGELPFHLKSCSNLVMLDVGENRLSGSIPSWIGTGLHQLKVLILRNNQFSGRLPLHLCYLTSIQFLDLALNNLVGQIIKCSKNFTAMAKESSSTYPARDDFNYYTKGMEYGLLFDLNVFVMWKGREQIFKNTKLLLKGIDLSSNQLIGEIPPELGTLVGLVSLNLSRNNLIGEIPSQIGQLRLLEFLDLSRNHFIGPIPSTLAQIDRLSMLDLSHNNLSGKIPISTQLQSFNASSYEENLDLCGEPLEKKCPEEEKPQKQVKLEEDKH